MELDGRAVGRRAVLLGLVGAGAAAALPTGVASARALPPGPGRLAPDVALRWTRTAYDLVLQENLTPPAAARTYAYAAIAMHEAVVAGMPAARSLAGSLTGLDRLPPAGQVHQVDWPTALTTAVAAVLREVLPFAGASTRATLDAAERRELAGRRVAGVGAGAFAVSVAHGRTVARHLVRWTRTDGHAGTVGRAYEPGAPGPDQWVSTPPNFRPAIEPHWSEVRPMALTSAWEVEPAPPLPFSTLPGSAFHTEAMTTFSQKAANTAEQEAIARFWTDNPGSFTPPFGTATGLPSGHWMQIAAQGLEVQGARLDLAVETLALTGIALHDAFLNCWAWKYHYRLLRPVTYINRHIDASWSSLVNSPQFPEHTSGHSVASPAAAAVLTRQLGTFGFTDRSANAEHHAPRTFTSFHHAAQEAAQSRLYGGIHFPHAISAGLVQGRQIGELVLNRVRTRA